MNIISFPTERLVALSFLTGVGPATLKKVLAIPRFEDMDVRELAARIPAISKAMSVPAAWESALDKVDQQIREAKRVEARILSAYDAEYPRLLAATKDDPLILYVRGALSQTPEQSVAIIGTREPTAHGKRIAARIAEFFVEHQWSVVSGLALGCDAVAHQATLDAGGHTVVVLAHGHQTIAPARHKKLANDILDAGGALVSEYPFGREIQKQQYVKRDRTQAGMAQGVVMIQSDVVGGSLHASRAALDYKRWLAVPYPTDKDREHQEPKIQANLLIADGADSERAELLHCSTESLSRVLILSSRDDYLAMLESSQSVHSVGTPATLMPRGTQARLHDALELEIYSDAKIDESRNLYRNTKPQFPPAFELAAQSSSEAHIPTAKSAPVTSEENVATHHCLCHTSILQCPSADTANTSWNELAIDMPAVSTALDARLRYLQSRLDSANCIYRELDSESSRTSVQTLLLTIDDFLAQLERAADFLLAIEHLFKSAEDDKGRTKNDAPQDLATLKADIAFDAQTNSTRQSDRKFMATLSALLHASTYRLLTGRWDKLDDLDERSNVVATGVSSDVADTLQQAKISVEELVTDFNDLAKMVLYAK
ncbi:DNA-processing protein DprA [Burkholderia dolosa]|uniref:DNA-processing protein DprA n=1 Tax=Burkholderia dolosa TaxID=152500 RepID=UPI001453DD16|nr:DNA-processing protein DprA [Burkholderia dolosa]UAK63754.1 DNA-protecting protein DprA [Burkholderia dolosa]VWB75617.1 DNA processing protein DprA [Burkholderia dolosa]